MSTISNIEFDYVSAEEIPKALTIEQEGYPSDEAGTENTFRLRQSQAGDLFLGVYEKSKSRSLIGFVCSTLSYAESLTHESMSIHVPDSPAVCIHSVCIEKAHQRKGIGLALLKEYIHRLENSNTDGVKYQRVLLITHEHLRSFYELAGFEWVGPSSVVHGSRPWFEMRRDIESPSRSDSSKTEVPDRMIQGHVSIPPNILEALGRPKDGILAGKLISDFHHGLSDLLEPDDSLPGTLVNKYNLVCSRSECGSLVLKKGVANWVERTSVQLEPEGLHQNMKLPALPTPPETAQWWLVTPSPMAFENIGFSRPLQDLAETGRRMKLLICAECELGPIGWCEEGGSEFWIACSRVAYRG